MEKKPPKREILAAEKPVNCGRLLVTFAPIMQLMTIVVTNRKHWKIMRYKTYGFKNSISFVIPSKRLRINKLLSNF